MAKGVKAQIRGFTVPVMAWASFICATLSGGFAPGMWLGHTIASVAHGMGWFILVVFFFFLALTVRDLAMDGEPNRVAVYSMMALPTIAASVPGAVGAWIAARSRDLVNWASEPIHAAVGDAAPTVVTLVLLAVAIAFAQRTVKSGSFFGGGKGRVTVGDVN